MNDKAEILLVEDDKSYAEMILMALQNRWYPICGASSGCSW